MSTEESLVRLLTDIRDVQREHLELYRKNSETAIAKQKQALDVTRRFQGFYRLVVFGPQGMAQAFVELARPLTAQPPFQAGDAVQSNASSYRPECFHGSLPRLHRHRRAR